MLTAPPSDRRRALAERYPTWRPMTLSVGTDLTSPRWRETFLSPRATFGTLIQFVDTTRRWDAPSADYDVADVLAGRVVWLDHVDCLR